MFLKETVQRLMDSYKDSPLYEGQDERKHKGIGLTI